MEQKKTTNISCIYYVIIDVESVRNDDGQVKTVTFNQNDAQGPYADKVYIDTKVTVIIDSVNMMHVTLRITRA